MRELVRSLLLIALVVCTAYGLHTLLNQHWLYAFYCWLALLAFLFLLWMLHNYEVSERYPDEEQQRERMEQEMLQGHFGSKHF